MKRVDAERFENLLVDAPQHHLGTGIHIDAICLHAHDRRRRVCTGLLGTHGPTQARPLPVALQCFNLKVSLQESPTIRCT